MWSEDEKAGASVIGSPDGTMKLKAGELWATALSEDGRFLAGTSHDGKVGVWDLKTLIEGNKKEGASAKIREYETKGSFGLCIDMVSCSSSIQILSS